MKNVDVINRILETFNSSIKVHSERGTIVKIEGELFDEERFAYLWKNGEKLFIKTPISGAYTAEQARQYQNELAQCANVLSMIEMVER